MALRRAPQNDTPGVFGVVIPLASPPLAVHLEVRLRRLRLVRALRVGRARAQLLVVLLEVFLFHLVGKTLPDPDRLSLRSALLPTVLRQNREAGFQGAGRRA